MRDASRRASVLVLTAYASQKNKYQYLLNKVTAAELPKSLVDVCTYYSIDDSFSPEAHYVFIDLI